MGLISNLLNKIFGSKNQAFGKEIQVNNSDVVRWQNEREERIKASEENLKQWLVSKLHKIGPLHFTWESGNDEGMVTFKDQTDDERSDFEELEVYILEKLDIPSAGEFEMNGNGFIYMDGNMVKAKYSSTLKELIDFNEETEEDIYGEEIIESDDRILFET